MRKIRNRLRMFVGKKGNPLEEDLAKYRGRIMSLTTIICVLVLLPFSVFNFIEARYLLAVGVLLVIGFLGLETLALTRGRRSPLPFGLPIVLGLSTVLSLKAQGIIGVFWVYPAVSLFFFVMSRRTALWYCIALTLVVTPACYFFVSPAIALRAFVTLVLTVILVGNFTRVIGDLQARLLEHAVTDPLTGVLNRRQLDTILGDAIERFRRNATPSSIVIFDLDHFKLINDSRGHAAGDDVLRAVAALIKARARRLDRLFRIGGEEFLLFLPETREEDAFNVADEIRATIGQSDILPDKPITLSAGVGELDGEGTETWIQEVDAALYAAKAAGRNCVRRVGARGAKAEPRGFQDPL